MPDASTMLEGCPSGVRMTVRDHIENIRVKLGASSRLEAVMMVMRLGIVPSG